MRFRAESGQSCAVHPDHGQSIGSNYGLTSQIFVLVHLLKYLIAGDGYLAAALIAHMSCVPEFRRIERLRRHYGGNCDPNALLGRRDLPAASPAA
jgi:hypothetical protein